MTYSVALQNWRSNGGVELGDVMIYTELRKLKPKRTATPKAISRRSAYIFQVKRSNSENGPSTRKQRQLFENWPRFTIVGPREVKRLCRTILDIRNPNKPPKSGFWYFANQWDHLLGESPSFAHIDSGTLTPDCYSLEDVVGQISNKTAGRDLISGDDPWSELVEAILVHKTISHKLRYVHAAASTRKSEKGIVTYLTVEPDTRHSYELKRLSYRFAEEASAVPRITWNRFKELFVRKKKMIVIGIQILHRFDAEPESSVRREK